MYATCRVGRSFTSHELEGGGVLERMRERERSLLLLPSSSLEPKHAYKHQFIPFRIDANPLVAKLYHQAEIPSL